MMSRSNLLLIGLGIAYPLASVVFLRLVTGIPHPVHMLVFGFIFPALIGGCVLIAKFAGVRFSLVGVLIFLCWMGIVGFLHFLFITALWNSI
jgi:hypothetical protein